MSQAQAKATRREIRRSMGAEALGVIEMHAGGINALAERVADQERRVSALEAEADIATMRHTDTLERLGGHAAALKLFTGMTFWARLRWLVGV
tara:strand:+ start:583 stop:861 length:279 start_codon:yes stop_codon:yes gene_type:complete